MLPSERSSGPARPAAPRTVLQDFDLTPDVLGQALEEIFAGTDEGQSLPLLRLLYRYRRIHPQTIHQWAEPLDQLDPLVQQASDHSLEA
ncbi:MAG: hypothetical protein GTO03_12485, partial [Planctomycetales bacterium]|nr:hypothetical protein [Planctomycetales bacterium]